MECSICYEKTTNTTSCNHYTCIECLIKIVRKGKNTCPICRTPFDIEPYKYVPPKHTPNLNLPRRKISMFNRFLRNRFYLEKNKKQHKFRDLMYKYTGLYYICNTYISLKDNFSIYEKYLLLEMYVHINSPECIYRGINKHYLTTKIEYSLCT